MGIFSFLRKNCSNCGWNLYAKEKTKDSAVKVSCSCNKKCVKYNKWKPIKSIPEPIKPKPFPGPRED